MAKRSISAISRYSQDAVLLLGRLVRQHRIEQKMTVQELAERLGVSRGLVQRIEKGDPGCAIGSVFEAAAITGIRLFNDAGRTTMGQALAANTSTLTLLPKTVRTTSLKVEDDF